MKISEQEWAQFGKGMMLLCGAACLALAIFSSDDILNWILRFIVGAYGIVSIGFAWFNRKH